MEDKNQNTNSSPPTDRNNLHLRSLASDLNPAKKAAPPTNIPTSSTPLPSSQAQQNIPKKDSQTPLPTPPKLNELPNGQPELRKPQETSLPPLPPKPTPPTLSAQGNQAEPKPQNLPPLPAAPDRQPAPTPDLKQNLGKNTSPQEDQLNKAPSNLEIPKKRRAPSRRRVVLMGLLAVVLFLFIAGEIWWFFIRPEPEQALENESNLPSPEETLPSQSEDNDGDDNNQEINLPAALLNYDQTSGVKFSESASNFYVEIEKLLNENAQKNTLINIVPILDNPEENTVLDFSSLNETLGITIPQKVLDNLSGAYNIFVLTTTAFDESTCRQAGITRPDCAGPRLGIVFDVSNVPALASALREWESEMPGNLKSLMLTEASITSGSFRDGVYRDTPLRYRNFPIDTMAIDYAISGNKLIITTSKSSMYKAIDSLSASASD